MNDAAAAIVAAWALGTLMEDLPAAAKATMQGSHALVGLAVLALLLPRILARVLGGAPAAAGPRWAARLAQAAHLLLYGLMLAMPLTGLLIAHGIAFAPVPQPSLGQPVPVREAA